MGVAVYPVLDHKYYLVPSLYNIIISYTIIIYHEFKSPSGVNALD